MHIKHVPKASLNQAARFLSMHNIYTLTYFCVTNNTLETALTDLSGKQFYSPYYSKLTMSMTPTEKVNEHYMVATFLQHVHVVKEFIITICF